MKKRPRLCAYVLAADPVWIVPSVRSYYNLVEEIVVSYDESSVGWSGQHIPVSECLDRLSALDSDQKLRFVPGHYSRLEHTPMENDTYQRQCALSQVSGAADWVLAIDTDEILPDADRLLQCLRSEVSSDASVIEWPMRVFFQRTTRGRYLEITRLSRRRYSEYPGPIASRPGVTLECARRAKEKSWRVGISDHSRDYDTWRLRASDTVIPKTAALLHMSWVRTEEEIRRKVSGWSHSRDFDSEKYLSATWRAAPRRWMFMRDIHPITPHVWPALWPTRLDPVLLAGGLAW